MTYFHSPMSVSK